MSDYNIEAFNSFSKNCLKTVSKHPEYRNKTAGKLMSLRFFGNLLDIQLEIPYDAMLRIYQYNYKRIQEALDKPS